MKTDKLLHLVQQKKAMRSGGALPLPKAQYGFMTPPGIKLQQVQQPAPKVASLNINKPSKELLNQFINIYDTAYEDYYNKFQKLNTFPKLSGKTVDLTAGRYRGAKVPIEYLNMIVESAKRSGVDPLQSLAQAARESTFLQDVNLQNKSKARYQNPMALVSGWNVDEKYQPYSWIRFLADKKVPGITSEKGTHGWLYSVEDSDETNQYLQSHPELKENYIQKINSALELPQTNFFDLYHNFIKEKGIKGYNPGDPDYINKVNKDIELLKSDPAFMEYYEQAVKKEGGLTKAQNGLQYVPNGTYGNYYDPSTQQYVPQVYLPDVEISASKSLPFQNGEYSPELTATGEAEYVPLEAMVALPAELPIAATSTLGRAAVTAAEILNPFGGLRPSPNMMYRGIGKEGFEDAVKSGVLRAQQHNYPAKRTLAEKITSPKQFGTVYYTPNAKTAMTYGKGYVAAVPKDAAEFSKRYGRKDWSWHTNRQIPINEATVYQKYPIVGYKKKLSFKEAGGLTASKAKEILHDKSVHGHPLTDKQRKYFGWVAGGKKKVKVTKPR